MGSKVFNTIIQLEPTACGTARNTSSNHPTLQKAAASSLAANNQATRRNKIITSYLQLGSSSNRCTPCLPTRNKIIYKIAFPAQFWVRKSFSKPVLSKGPLNCPSGRHKLQSFIETKTLRFCNLDTKNFKKWTWTRSQKWNCLAVPACFFYLPNQPSVQLVPVRSRWSFSHDDQVQLSSYGGLPIASAVQ